MKVAVELQPCLKNRSGIGVYTYEEIVSYYARAKAFIFPGEEDFGLTPIEAQASGTHVSAYDRGG